MTLQTQIELLEKLSTIDQKLSELDAALAQERVALDGKQTQLGELSRKLQSTESSIGEMEKIRAELVGEARQTSSQMERARDKLMRCRTEREVNAAQREMEELRKLFKDREVEIQKIAGLIEQARLDVQQTEGQRQAVSGDLGASQDDVETRMSQLETQAQELREQRVVVVKDVPPVLYRRYEMIRTRRGSGLSHTTAGTCSACHISFSPMFFQTLRRGEKLDQCPSCNRIIYFRAEAEEGSEASGEDASAEVEQQSQEVAEAENAGEAAST